MTGKATWSVFVESFHDFRRTWPQLFVTDLVSRAVAFIIIAPAFGLMGKAFLWRSADGVVTDAHIITDRVAVANRIKELRAEVSPAGRFIVWIAGEIGLLKGLDNPSLEEDA